MYPDNMSQDGEKQMLALPILVISAVALSQFALSYWRSILFGVAAVTVSVDVRAAAGLKDERITGRDFNALAEVHRLTPGGPAGVGFVGFYYRAIRGIGTLVRLRIPAIAHWTELEMSSCAQYVAVRIDQRLQANLALM
jgi:hypothetical protein